MKKNALNINPGLIIMIVLLVISRFRNGIQSPADFFLGILLMLPGIVIGVVGIVLAIINYPMHKAILGARRKKYADKIIELSDELMNG